MEADAARRRLAQPQGLVTGKGGWWPGGAVVVGAGRLRMDGFELAAPF